MSSEQKSNIFLFFGEDTYSSQQKINFWKSEFIKKYGDESDIEVTEGKRLDPKSFLTNIEALPFFSEKRLVIVTNLLSDGKKEQQKIIADNLDKIPDFSIVVFAENKAPNKTESLYKKLKKIAKIEEFMPKPPGEVTAWILKKAQADDIKISRGAAAHLANHATADLWQISNELEKLKQYAGGAEITDQMIDELVTPSLVSTVFKLTDAIAARRADESLKIFQTLQDMGEEDNKIFFMIARHFRLLIQAKDLFSRNEKLSDVAKLMKQPPFVIQKLAQQEKNFPQAKLKKIHDQMLEIDIETKTGKNKNTRLAIEKLIIECCR